MWTINKLLILGCAGSLLLRELFSNGGEWMLRFNCGAQASHRGGFSYCGAQALGRAGSVVAAPRLQSTGSVVAVLGLSCFKACGIFPDQGSKPCFLHLQAGSLPLNRQGSCRAVLQL